MKKKTSKDNFQNTIITLPKNISKKVWLGLGDKREIVVNGEEAVNLRRGIFGRGFGESVHVCAEKCTE